MTDDRLEVGSIYLTPLGRRVEFLGIEAGGYLFAYLGTDDKFALSRAGASILHRKPA